MGQGAASRTAIEAAEMIVPMATVHASPGPICNINGWFHDTACYTMQLTAAPPTDSICVINNCHNVAAHVVFPKCVYTICRARFL